ncbi:hypothetical protein PEPS_01230 [Persicobacter psychrovividus]|uniref:Uncharacterized protein n=1 Tax=Persicobacter psychrovividus TaxID=387638 RepID=A0ABN6L430_9BACT|nr:hypothetical protein PEPS_01230 [Persicobacter psychrovividus]
MTPSTKPNNPKSFNNKVLGVFFAMLLSTGLIALSQIHIINSKSRIATIFPTQGLMQETALTPNFHLNFIGIFTDLVLRR